MKILIMCLMMAIAVPTCLPAASVVATKIQLIKKANHHKEQADWEMKDINRMIMFLENTNAKDHLDTLIKSCIVSLRTKGPQAVLIICLAQLAELSSSLGKAFETARTKLHEAFFHLEMANFYDEISLKYSNRKADDDMASVCFMDAIESLTKMQMTVQSLMYNPNDQSAITDVVSTIHEQKMRLIQYFEEDKVVNAKKMHQNAMDFYENFDEMLSQLGEKKNKYDADISDELQDYALNFYEDILSAVIEWGYDPYEFGEGLDCYNIRLLQFLEKIEIKRLQTEYNPIRSRSFKLF